MGKICKGAAAAAAMLFIFILAASAASAETGEETSLTELVISLDREYSRCRFTWDGPEGMEYEATLQALDSDGSVRDHAGEYCSYPYFQAEDYIAYFCQQYGVPYRMRLRVTGKDGDEVTAEGYSETFDPRDFWPEKEVLRFGEDIPMEDISSVSWSSSGDYAEANWSYSASAYDGRPRVYFRRAGRPEREIRISAARWNRLLSVISEGWMEIRWVQDPSIVMLDGVEEGKDVIWKERFNDHRLSYYGLRFDGDGDERIEKWFISAVQWSIYGWKLRAVIASCILAVCAAAYIFLKGRR